MATPASGDFPTADFPTLRAALDEAMRLAGLTHATHVVVATIHEQALTFLVLLEATYAFLRERGMTRYLAPVALASYDPVDEALDTAIYDAVKLR